jgi:hypothetical protein
MIGSMALTPERTGVLVVRAWLEEESAEKPLRARITSTLDVSAPRAPDTIGAASEKEVVNAVRAWLRAFVSCGDGAVTDAE